MRRSFHGLLLLVPLLGACSMTIDATKVGVPVTLASDIDAPAQGERFDVSSTALWAFWGAVPVKRSSVRETLATQLVGAREVKDVRIHMYSRWYQVAISVVTLGVLVPRTVRAEGVIVGGVPAITRPAPAGAAPSPALTPAPAVPK
jgi:hypothetical protein